MKRVLIIKTSSMGDVIHTLPALTDAYNAFPGIRFDWVVEPGFAELPRWHQSVDDVILYPFRRWRKSPWQSFKAGEYQAFLKQLRLKSYDAVIDAQGLVKSALVTCFARGPRLGADFSSAREALASFFYQRKVTVNQKQHAVVRARQLFAQTLQYPIPSTPADYAVDRSRLPSLSYGDNTLVFLHGTTWPTKHWPQRYWEQLAYLASSAGYQVLLPWGNESERERANSVRDFSQRKTTAVLPQVLPKLSLGEITSLIGQAKGIVAVDTGLGHIAAAMAAPTVSLYGPTDPDLTGAHGPKQVHLRVNMACSPCLSRDCKQGQHFSIMPPCFESLPPEKVWQALQESIATQLTIRRHSRETNIKQG